MTLKGNVKPLAEINPISTLCTTIKWHTMVGAVQEKECFAGKMEHDDQLSWHCKPLESHQAYKTDLREPKRKYQHTCGNNSIFHISLAAGKPLHLLPFSILPQRRTQLPCSSLAFSPWETRVQDSGCHCLGLAGELWTILWPHLKQMSVFLIEHGCYWEI